MVAQTWSARIQQHIESISNPMVSLSFIMLTTRNKLISDLQNGEAKECFASHVYSHRKEYGLNENEAMFAVLNAIEGGSDTTRATLNVFIAAMATDPEFLVRVRKELDAVCGDAGRLPTFADHAQLPLVTACVKEVLRWMPLVAAGVVRVLIQDDQFEDYYFPKGTRFSIIF
jgi:cytochrome P450